MILFFSFLITILSKLCKDADPSEMMCEVPSNNCNLDEMITTTCSAFPSTNCQGSRTFEEKLPCRYCFELPESQIICEQVKDCKNQIKAFQTPCYPTAKCIGNSTFFRKARCHSGSKSQKTAILLSLFLGGVGADRFYLGYYVEAAFKLLTVGGLGIAYAVDLILIMTGFLGPKNGRGYIERS